MVKIAEHINELSFSPQNIAVVNAGGKKICVARYNEKLFAFTYKCPHAGGLLAYGHIDAKGNVVCPLHRYRFDICNGRNTSGEGYHLKHWNVIENEEGIFVEMETSGGWW